MPNTQFHWIYNQLFRSHDEILLYECARRYFSTMRTSFPYWQLLLHKTLVQVRITAIDICTETCKGMKGVCVCAEMCEEVTARVSLYQNASCIHLPKLYTTQ